MKVLVVGAGGIGSIVLRLMDVYALYNRFEVTVADGDAVEPKNLKYQDYSELDVGWLKSDVMAERYGVEALGFINEQSELEGYDYVIVAVDNNRLRRMLEPEKYTVIDARAEGKVVALFLPSSYKDSKFFTALEGDEHVSCQRESRLKEGKVDVGNAMAAVLAVNALLSYEEGETPREVVMHI